MDTLTALFGSHARVKILRLFIFNPATPFLAREVAYRARCTAGTARKELGALVGAGVLKKRQVLKDVGEKQGNEVVFKKAKGAGYFLNDKFPYTEPLKNLLTAATIQADESLLHRFSRCGKLRFLVAAGAFIQNWDSRIDLLIVGDNLNLPRIESVIRFIESEIGKEIAYSAFETADFEYRYGIHDRLVRDILDYNHVTLLDRLGIEPQ